MKKLSLLVACLLCPLICYGTLGETFDEQVKRHTTKVIGDKNIDPRFRVVVWKENEIYYNTGFLDGVAVFERQMRVDNSPFSPEDLSAIMQLYSKNWAGVYSEALGQNIFITSDGVFCVMYGSVKGLGENIVTIISMQYAEYIIKRNKNTIVI